MNPDGMFKNRKRNLKRQRDIGKEFQSDNTVDPGQFNDPKAFQTQWTPLNLGGGNFRSHKLSAVGRNIIKVNPGLVMVYMGLVCGFLGGIFLMSFFILFLGLISTMASIIFGLDLGSSNGNALIGVLFMIFFMGFFGFTGYWLSVGFVRAFLAGVFDKTQGYFRKGISLPLLHLLPGWDRLEKVQIPLNEIHAVQVIKGKWDDDYFNYELNIILGNSERIEILTHAYGDKIKEDARKLSEFLGVSLWDAVPD